MTTYLDRALADGHAALDTSGFKTHINYVAVGRSEIYNDPEEKVRAEFWAELIYRYGYKPERIGVEITVPDRMPKDAADLVVFSDDERKTPWAVLECKKDGISDAEFAQAVEQAAGNGTWATLRALYVGVVAGLTRRFLDFGGTFGALEREKNVIADLPGEYGKPEEFKYRKGTAVDIEPVSKETLIQAIRKSHQTLWSGGRLSPPQAFGELCKLIFVKIADEQAKRKVGEPYQFQIKTHETAKRLAGRIKELYGEHQEARSKRLHRHDPHRGRDAAGDRFAPGGHQSQRDRPRCQGSRIRAVHGWLLQGRLRPVLHASRDHRVRRRDAGADK